MRPFYATTPIYYVNDLPHIGHIYTTVVGGRHRRGSSASSAEDTRFLTGTDEHGQNIEKAAAAQGVTPIALADRVVRALPGALEEVRDPQRRLHPHDARRGTGSGVEALIARMEAAGDFYTAKHEGWYCASCEAFYTEKELDAEKRCPVHGTPCPGSRRRTSSSGSRSTRRRCSRCTRAIPSSSGRRPAWPRSSSFVARRAERPVGLALEGARGGSRFPGHPGHVVYVWLDALANYITALGFGRRTTRSTAVLGGPGGPARPPHRQGHPALPRRLLAGVPAVGRPAAADDGLGPRLVAARREEDVQVRRQRRAARRPRGASSAPDALRYFLMREMAFGQDAHFSDEAFLDALQRRSRQRPRQHRVAGRGALPAVLRRDAPRDAATTTRSSGRFRPRREEWRAAMGESPSTARSRPCGSFWRRSTDTSCRGSPGRSARRKGRLAAARAVLYAAAEGVRAGGRDALARSFRRPRAAIFATFGLPPQDPRPRISSGGACRSGAPMPRRASALPARRRRRVLRKQRCEGCGHERRSPKASRRPPRRPRPPPSDDRISIEDFQKVRLVTARVLAAERVPKSNKLCKLRGGPRERAAPDRRGHRGAVRAGGPRRAATSSSSRT